MVRVSKCWCRPLCHGVVLALVVVVGRSSTAMALCVCGGGVLCRGAVVGGAPAARLLVVIRVRRVACGVVLCGGGGRGVCV